MPKNGTATNTHSASAAVVESEASRRLVAGNDGAEAGCGDKQEERAQKADIFLRLTQAYLFNLFLDAGDDDFQKVLPAGTFQADGKFARDES